MTTRDARARLRELVEGTVAGATYPIEAGRFSPGESRYEPAMRTDSGGHRTYELLTAQWADSLAETGPQNVTGTIVEQTVTLQLVVTYHEGGGSRAGADRMGTNAEQEDDLERLRRALTYPGNWDSDNSGIMDVTLTRAVLVPARPDASRLAEMRVTLVALVRSQWNTEP